jgi:hypothetical protein
MKLSELKRRARANGWTATRTGTNHLRLEHPEAARPVISGGTPSDGRWAKNTLAEMKRALPRLW